MNLVPEDVLYKMKKKNENAVLQKMFSGGANTDFHRVCGNVGLQLNLIKVMFMRNGQVSDAPLSLNGTNISGCSSYMYPGREVNMPNDLAPELSRRKRAACGAFKGVE
ncbi:unnamed protein product [Heligmosomoides polygyrus]|uniref:Uncharacterized protein n=1 Tax=Heligmosomoides polygyrus TaxID=6339 RepID=A0A183GLQ8_HELPZ|nr:unnamed protein product [Heligmosomoides polygyrus]